MRRATLEDLDALLEMARRFAVETEYRDVLDIKAENVEASIKSLMANPDSVCFISGNGTPTGMIAMLAYDHPFSGERTAFEIVWWVNPEARGDGVKLLRAVEEWAKEQGIHKIQMVAPNERVGTLYQRLGYKPVEVSYQRSL